MSAKRELSSTLRNLKFMQRAVVAQKIVDKAELKDEAMAEVAVTPPSAAAPAVADGGFGSSAAQVARKCVVIMEGNPHPGAVKGRMSFLNFNPAIDKLNDEASGRQTQSASPSNSHQDVANSSRTNDVSATRFRDFNVGGSESISPNELKRKEPALEMETPPSQRPRKTDVKNANGESTSRSNGRRSRKSNKRERLDWSLLRQRKSK